MARTTTTPACGLTSTLRPPSLPTSVVSAACNSCQKSLAESVRIWLAAGPCVVSLPPLPESPLSPLSPLSPDFSLTWPEETRVCE